MEIEAPEGWRFEFDSFDEHCGSYIDGELSGTRPPALESALAAFLDGGAREALNEHVREALDTSECESREIYEELWEILARHESCGCSQWAWESDREYLEVLLEEIEHTSWFVSHGSDAEELLQDALSYNVLSQLLGRNGWYRLRVSWDPARGLEVDTESHSTTLTPASEERLALSEAASELGHWEHLSLAKEISEGHLAIATALADTWVAAGRYYSATEARVLLAPPEDVPALTAPEEEIARSLVDDWSGSLPELLEAARSLVHV